MIGKINEIRECTAARKTATVPESKDEVSVMINFQPTPSSHSPPPLTPRPSKPVSSPHSNTNLMTQERISPVLKKKGEIRQRKSISRLPRKLNSENHRFPQRTSVAVIIFHVRKASIFLFYILNYCLIYDFVDIDLSR